MVTKLSVARTIFQPNVYLKRGSFEKSSRIHKCDAFVRSVHDAEWFSLMVWEVETRVLCRLSLYVALHQRIDSIDVGRSEGRSTQRSSVCASAKIGGVLPRS